MPGMSPRISVKDYFNVAVIVNFWFYTVGL